MAWQSLEISESCYRYLLILLIRNAEIFDWLIRLTTTYQTWGLKLPFPHLRNLKGDGWNHNPVDLIYRQLELNLQIEPKK